LHTIAFFLPHFCFSKWGRQEGAFDHWLEKTGSFVEEPWPKRKGGRSEPEEEQLALF